MIQIIHEYSPRKQNKEINKMQSIQEMKTVIELLRKTQTEMMLGMKISMIPIKTSVESLSNRTDHVGKQRIGGG